MYSSLTISCNKCRFKNEFLTSKQCGKGYDINRRSVYTFRSLGHGHTGIEKFTSLMDMPRPMASSTYDKIANLLSTTARSIAEESMQDAAEDARSVAVNDNNDIANIGVSVDGAWTRRGHSSINCVVTAISLHNGKVIDVEPMARSCKACNLKQPMKESDPVGYSNWKEGHVCKYAYRGSAPAMEQHGTKAMFERSVEKYKVRYTNFLGDGDTKSFSKVKDIYDGFPVTKLECVGHYQKRIGSRTKRLKKTTKGMGGRGRLTNATTDRLQNYFGMAIRQNAGNLKEIQAAARATLFHVSSSAKNNWHYPHCPTGPESWCRYNRDKATNSDTYKPGPGLPLEIVQTLKPIFEELTTDANLSKCLHGRTQNQNESFNATIWDRIPKCRYVSLKHLEFGVYDAVSNFNMGRKASVLTYEQLAMTPGKYMLRGCFNLNSKRLSRSEYKNASQSKLRRKIIRGNRMKKSDKDTEKEGKTYAPGGF